MLSRLRSGRIGYVNESEQSGCLLRQVDICATKQAGSAMAGLRRPDDKPGALEVVHAAIEGPHGLLGPAREQFAPREDGCERTRCVDCAGQGGEQGTRACRQRLRVRGSMSGPENDPRQIRTITSVLIESFLIGYR